MRELHLTGAYGVQEILEYNRTERRTAWNFPRFFPLRKLLPEFTLGPVEEGSREPGSVLVVVNLDGKTWDLVQGLLTHYERTVLVQMEAYLGWEVAFQRAGSFDRFVSFDPSYAWHPGYSRFYLPYEVGWPSSHRDRRGLPALRLQWRHSKRALIDLYTWWFKPRRKKAALISTLNKGDRYQIRLEVARRWADRVDVYGGGWPADLPNYRGLSVSKLATLRRYSHAVVFENQRQPGYITEKLLDCFAAGTVPIYWGAPDIKDNVPTSTVIEFESEDVPIGEIVNDEREYSKRRAAIHRERRGILERYRKERFFECLTRAIRQD
jgi:hypothetical protein